MKSTLKVFVAMQNIAIIALIAVIGFSFVACGDGDGGGGIGGIGGGETTYTYNDAEGNAYKMLITSEGRAAYKPREGDTYVLSITFKNGTVKASTGTVTAFTNGIFTLKSSDNKIFEVMVKGEKIAQIDGDVPVTLPVAKRVTINGFTTWQGKTANNGGNYYHSFGVFLIADPSDMYDERFPRVNALWYETVQKDGSAGNVNFDLIIPVYNTWNFGRMPWTGTGSYYVVIVPCVSPYFYEDEAKIYTDGGTPVTISINRQTTTLEFSKFTVYAGLF